MKNYKLVLTGLLNAIAVFLYISGLSWVLFNGEKYFSGDSNFLMPTMMLLIFVISATITGLLVLGRPIYLYLNNLKSEAIKLLIYTVIFLLLIVIITLLVNVFVV